MNSKQSKPQCYAVEMLHIDKSFGALHALDDVTLQVKYGEVHAILGENGAGKSTLMSILFGLKHMDSGEIRVDGKKVNIRDPNDAADCGIGMVHQHFKLVDIFSVLDNIVLGREEATLGFRNIRKEREKVQRILDTYGIDLNLKAKISDISVASQQKTEIVKVLYRNADILIFDEPTAVLTPQEIDNLMRIIRGFAEQGKAVILITHKLNEIKQVADTVTIMRRGRGMGTYAVKDCSQDQLAELMVGKKVNFTVDKKAPTIGKPVLEIQNFSCLRKDKSRKADDDVSLVVHAGEIAAIAAIEGNGQEELIQSITGIDRFPKTSGKIIFHKDEKSVDLLGQNIKQRIDEGISDIPADRLRYGLLLDYDVQQNLISRELKAPYVRAGFLNSKAISTHGEKMVQEFDIRSSSGIKTRTGDMSGGNQQKVIIARELGRKPVLLISDQATRGLDVGAIEFVNKEIIRARDAGAAVLLYSTELEDIFNLADVIYVMHEGKIVATLDPKKTDYQEIGYYMGGGRLEVEDQKSESVEQVVKSEKIALSPCYRILERCIQKGMDYPQAKSEVRSIKRMLAHRSVTALGSVGCSFAELPQVKRSIAKDLRNLSKKDYQILQRRFEKNSRLDVVASESDKPSLTIQEAIEQDEKRTAQAVAQVAGKADVKGALSLKSKKIPFIFRSSGSVALLDSILAILIGLFLGFIVMLAVYPGGAVSGFASLFTSFVRRKNSFGQTIWYTGPLILLGLSVAIPNKGGLFNIGASGQFTIGAVCAFVVANYLSPYIANQGLFVLVMITGILAGALYGMIPGLLKAFLNVNEVVSTIMLNWTSVYVSMIVITLPKIYDKSTTAANYAVPGANVPTLGLDKIFPAGSRVDLGILVALVLAVVIYIVISNTKYGFKLRASGMSKDASKYCGYSRRSIVVSSMTLGGAMAGLAAIFYFFPSSPQGLLTPVRSVASQGFDGISIALIANNNPLGTILSAFFLSMLKQANIPLQQAGYDKNIVNVIMGVVIYSTAAVKLVSFLVKKGYVRYALNRAKKAKSAQVDR